MSIAVSKNPWLECYTQRPEAMLRLFCFPYAGGAALIYRNWGKKLPQSIEVCPVQLPGRWGRISEPPYRNCEALVADLALSLQGVLEEKPYVLFGHSMGALVAFELTRHLEKNGGPLPNLLMVSSFLPPQLSGLSSKKTFDLPEQEFVRKIREMEGTHEEILDHPEMLRLLLPTLRADFELVESYRYHPGAKLSRPIVAFGSPEDREVSYFELWGWGEVTTGEFHLEEMAGGHFFIQTQEDLLLEKLKPFLYF